jgi:hypothetical protein
MVAPLQLTLRLHILHVIQKGMVVLLRLTLGLV